MSGFRRYIPVAEVRGKVLRCWRAASPELRGWNAVPCDVTRFLLRDGRLVEQEWPCQAETPSGHYIVREGARAAEEVDLMTTSPRWTERDPADYAIIGGVRR